MTGKRTVINFEAREFWFVHMAKREARSLCKGCGVETIWLTPEQVVVVTSLSAREVFRRVESGRLHFKETEEGFLFVCSQSLAEENQAGATD